MWYIPTDKPVSHIVALPRSDIYAVFLTTPHGTEVFVLSPGSWKPVRHWKLDLQLRQVVSFESYFPRGFSLVCITHDWEICLVGDNVWLPDEEGASGNNISERQEKVKLSLFEDVFGRSAFKSLERTWEDSERNRLLAASKSAGKSGKIDLRLLDGPAHLLPPLETLYTSLMSGLLQEVAIREDPEDQGAADQDDQMDVVEEEEGAVPTEVGSRVAERVVSQAEIDMFTVLFKEHATICM